MRRRLRNLGPILSSTGTSLALLVGLPVALVRFVGNPFPTLLPSRDDVSWHLTNGQIPDAFWIGLFTLILWFVWAQLTTAFAVELAAAIRGIEAPSWPGLGLAQLIMGPLVARAVVVASMAGTPALAATAPPLPFATVSAPLPDTANHYQDTGILQSETTAIKQQTMRAAVVTGPTVEIGRRDTLRSIAADRLGDPDQWQVLRDANLGTEMPDGTVIDADTVIIKPGWTLTIPTTTNTQPTPITPTEIRASEIVGSEADSSEFEIDTAGSGEVGVVEGDHFWSLAQTTLADTWGRTPTDSQITPYWANLVDANADRLMPPQDPDLIHPGQVFVIPSAPVDPALSPSAALSATEPLTQHVTEDRPATPQPQTPAAKDTPTQTPGTTPVAAAPTVDPGRADGRSLPSAETVAKVALTSIGGFTLALATITLNRLRRRRLSRRSRSAPPPPEKPETLAIEDQVRALSTDGEAARYTAAFNPWLAHALKPGTTIPSIAAVKAGANGLEILLHEPAAMGDQFVSISDTATAWRLASHVTDRQMEKEAGTIGPYAPMLLPVGDTPTGELLIDFEELCAISVVGDDATRDGLLRNLVVTAVTSPWIGDTEIVAIGIPGLHPTENSRIVVPDDPQTWAHEAVAQAKREAADTTRSPYEDRIDGIISDNTARFVVVGAGHTGIAQHLATGAELAYSSLTLVSGSELASEFRLVADDGGGGGGVLEPLSLRFDIDLVDDADLADLDELMTQAQADQADTGQTANIISSNPVQQARLEEVDPETSERINQILESKGVEVRVLRETPDVVGVDLTPKPTAITAYIALHPGVDAAKVRDLFWPNDNTRAPDNAFTRLRKSLGETSDGTKRLPKERDLTLTDVGADWHRFQSLTTQAAAADRPGNAAAFLDAALELIEGEPGKRVAGALWSWFTDDRTWYETIDTLIVDTAAKRADLALQAGDPIAARHAVRQGQRASPNSETLLMYSMNATKHLEGDRKVDTEFTDAIAEAEAIGYDLTPELHRFYQDLRGQPNLSAVDPAETQRPTSSSKPEQPDATRGRDRRVVDDEALG